MIDFETYSEAGFLWDESAGKYRPPLNASKKGLPSIGAAAYAEHPSTEVLCCAYDLHDGLGIRLWKPGMFPPVDLFDYVNSGGLIEAWNVTFERWIWTKVCMRLYGWPAVGMHQWRDSAAKSVAHALPKSLDAAGKVLDISHKKDKDGMRLLKKFSMPRDPTARDARRRIRLEDDPVDAQRLYDYNVRDIEAEHELTTRIPELIASELEFWQYDQLINHRGVAIDLPLVRAAISVVQQAHDKYNLRLRTLTSGTVQRASELAKLRGWMNTRGVTVATLDSSGVTELLRTDIPDDVREALEIRELIGSAAVKKLYAMVNQVTSDGRLHDLFIYHSARTGRAAGSGPQPQNLPNSGPTTYICPSCSHHSVVRDVCTACGNALHDSAGVEWGVDAVEQAARTLRTGNLECVEYLHGNAIATVSGCLRGMFVSAPGHDLICSDYSAIEAVVLAALAGEQWRMDVFRTHGKIYEASAAALTGKSVEFYAEHKRSTGSHHPDRKLGKTLELALGYGGWIGAMKAFGADSFMTDDEIKKAVLAWRDASPAVVEFWGGQRRGWFPDCFGLEGAVVQAIQRPGVTFDVRGLTWCVTDDVLYCTLLSGRRLTYHHPRLHPSERKLGTHAISYEGFNSNPKYGAPGWVRLDTYSGKLAENCIQATARDILAHAIVQLERAGYPVVLHVHDEIVAEVPEGFGSVEEFERIMSTMPSWAADWPLKASGGWRRKRYGK